MTAKTQPEDIRTNSAVPHVLQAIASVMEDIGKEGIAKGRDNNQQGYKFRGIDDVYNALAPILASHKLIITPRCKSRLCEERQTRNGGALFNVVVEADFELSSALDGSSIIATTFGEAMDSADKATNKAMSAAYKYMAMQQFCIPTEGDNDADAITHEVAPRQAKPTQSSGRREQMTPAEKPTERSPAAVSAASAAIAKCATQEVLTKWVNDNHSAVLAMHDDDRAEVRKAVEAQLKKLKAAAKPADKHEEDPFTPRENGIVTAMKAAISIAENRLALDRWADDNKASLDKLSDDDYQIVLAFWKARGEELRPERAAA